MDMGMGMRSTFMGYETSRTALRASQKALDIVGHNLANVSSEGYVKQRADQVSINAYAYKNRVSVNSYNNLGTGTSIKGISQVRDECVDAAFRSNYSETSYYSKSNDMLSDIESIMNEIDIGTDGTGYGLSWAMKQMYTSLEDVANGSNVNGDATVFAESVRNVTTLLNNMSASLDDACNDYKDELKSEVSDANQMMADIYTLNKQIKDVIATNGYTEQYGPNELIDERNVLLDKLSSFGKVEIKSNSDGTIDVSLNGHKCVEGDNPSKLDNVVYQENKDGTVSLRWKSNSESASTDSGILKAAAEVINGKGVNISGGEDATVRGFKYYKDVLDTFAGKLADVLNTSLPAEFDSDGNVISYKKLVGDLETDQNGSVLYPDRHVTADSISVCDEFLSDPSYMRYDKNSNDNTYVLNLLGRLSTEKYEFSNGAETYKGTFQEYITEYAGKLGSDVQYASARYESYERLSNELQDTRESIMGVSESEETVDMLTYNRAFQAAAKMMTTMDELLDVVINQIGALG